MVKCTLNIEDSVAVITFTSSQHDLLSFDAVTELADLLDAIRASSDETSVIMLTGTDGLFVPDIDRDELVRISEGEPVSGDILAWHRVVTALESLPQPTVAAIDGQAGGGGSVVALACTFRIASERSVFGPVEFDLGVIGTETTANLVRLVGPALGAELLLTGRQLDAPAAKQLGVINEVLASERFAAQARDWCQRITALPLATVFAVKRAVIGSTNVSWDELLDLQPPNSDLVAAQFQGRHE